MSKNPTSLLAACLGLTLAACGGQPSDISTEDQPLSTPLPGRIEAEGFRAGGEGVAYHDVTPKNQGGVFTTQAVDVQATTDLGGGYNVGWIAAGEWITYAINLPSSGSYRLTLRVAAADASTKTVRLSVDGKQVGTVSFAAGGGWQVWKDAALTAALPSGAHVLRLDFDSSLFNLNYIDVKSTDTSAPSAPAKLTASAAGPTQVSLSWSASTDNVGVTGYLLFRDGAQVASVSGTSYEDSALVAGTAYTYSVKAKDAAGNLSVSSASVEVTTSTSLPYLGAAAYTSTSGLHLDFTDFESQLQGDLKARRTYDSVSSIPSSFASSAAKADVSGKDVTFYSMKLDPGAFPAGTLDAQFNQFLASIPSGHPTYLTYWHEPEDDIAHHTVAGSTALTLASWQASVNHMGQLIHATHRPELHNMIIFMGPWSFSPSGYGTTEFWASGFDANVDAIGIDPYTVQYTCSDGSRCVRYSDVVDQGGGTAMMSWIHLHAKPFGITEIGAHEPDSPSAATHQAKADWIARQWEWAKANHALCFLYFNYNAVSGLPDVQSNIIISGSPAETTFRSMVREANP